MKHKQFFRLAIFVLMPILGLCFLLADSHTISNIGSFETFFSKDIKSAFNSDSDLDKQRGAHVFGPIKSNNLQFLKNDNIEWMTLVPWGYQEDIDSPIMKHHNGDSIHIMQHDSSWVAQIQIAREAGFKVLLKPHIWMHRPSSGKWRSDIYPTNEKNWQLWQESYTDFILRYARLAQIADAEMFCIGMELSLISVQKPEYWRKLINEVRSVYCGEITYAGNWYEEYEKITFWDELDYIGIQAYFPLVKNHNPSVEQISKGWKKYLNHMEAIAERYHRPIIFTELGYKSSSDSAIEPWLWVENPTTSSRDFSLETQSNCYKAFFNTVWPQEWFAGVHLWQYRTDYMDGYIQDDDMDFTPQTKPAQRVIAKGFE